MFQVQEVKILFCFNQPFEYSVTVTLNIQLQTKSWPGFLLPGLEISNSAVEQLTG